ncbi:transcription elongation factor A protein 3 isoform X4 [Leuresthes tenuis]|uniref:transcription elongation factor A protein 3 isoform X4 n=1 Tax=Leuresthes tenuis TaxID=355514 RepID=UPI003B502CF4
MSREEDLMRIAKKLDKMVSRNNTEGALDLLKELKGFNVTLKLLQETRIGMSVNAIRKHCTDEEVIALAKVLIKDWKRLLDSGRSHSEKAAETKNGLDSTKTAAAPDSSPSETHSRKDSVESKVPKKHSDDAKKERKDSSDSKLPPPKTPSVEVKKEKHRKDSCDSKPGQPVKRHSTDSKPDRRESSDSKKSSPPPVKKLTGERRESLGSKPPQPGPPQRKASTDGIERKGKTEAPRTPTTPTSPMSPSFSSAGGPLPPHLATGVSIRDKCIEMLAAALRTDNDYKDFGANCDSMAAEIEDHIYQEIKATDMKYKNRVRSRISNLKDPKNPGLRKNVLAGNIEMSRIATMSAEEMASDELKQLRNVLTQEAIREHQMAKTGGTTTDLLQCGKCRKKNCTYNQVQTRSADEPMTTFVLCNECGNRWKFC